MTKKTLDTLSTVLISQLSSIADPDIQNEHGHENEYHNFAIKKMLESSFLRPMFVDEANFKGSLSYVRSAAKDAEDRVDELSQKHEHDLKEGYVPETLQRAYEKSKQWDEQLRIVEEWAGEFQEVYMHFLGKPYQYAAKSAKTVSKVTAEEILNRKKAA
jgi:hypothetical protein